MHKLLEELYPICRSLTGDGVRKTLEIIKKHIPIQIHSVSSGEKVYDWTVPNEWNINDAYIKNDKGEKVIDFKNHNLHILNYSIPFRGQLTYKELVPHLYCLKEFPDWIPYLTSYYKEKWGFCLTYNQFQKLDKNTNYEVVIDSKLDPGELNYADLIIPGKSNKEILLSTYICHPSMCNDILSGIVVLTFLAKYLLKRNNYYTYRIIFIPETIGSIVYINKNFDKLKENVIGGYTITCVGDEGDFTYLQTRLKNQFIDKITLHILKNSTNNFKLRDFIWCGSDERQYNYPGVNLNIGSLMKSKYGEFDQYHTSGDDLNFVTEKGLNESYKMYIKCLKCIEYNNFYINTNLCEPQLGKRGLYPNVGGQKNQKEAIMKRMVTLQYSDGIHNLLDIAEILNVPIWELYDEIDILLKSNLLKIG